MKQWEGKDLVEEAFKEDGLLSKMFDGYSVREQQVELAKEIQRAIREGEHLLGEAPTGVGKSLGALIPAFETIVNEDKPVIVVTSSIILQEQYFNKDIPLLEKIFDYKTGAVLIKGRSNYLCKTKLTEFKAGNFTNTSTRNQNEIENILRWSTNTVTGDVSELPFVPSHSVWSNFASVSNHDCQRKECPLYEQCHYYTERRKVQSSKLVICNYHYFFNAMETEGMLPDGAKVIIMDEGHEIASIGRDFQKKKYNTIVLKDVFNNFLKVFKSIERSHSTIDIYQVFDNLELDLLQSTLDEMFFRLTKHFIENKPRNRENWTVKPEQRKAMQWMAQNHLDQILSTESYLMEYFLKHGLDSEERFYWHQMYDEETIQWQIALENLYEELVSKRKILERFFLFESAESSVAALFGEENEIKTEPKKENETIVYWLETFNENSVSLYIGPSSIAELTGPLFMGETSMIVLSATLTVNKEFGHLKHDLGITEPINELIVTSPFDLTSNMLWYLPHDVPAGNSAEHKIFMMEEMLKVIRELHGKTLCLFTSNRNLIDATNHFRKVLPDTIKVLAQGELPKQRLITEMKSNPNVVIMGTRSFFTGVDIQGQNLSAVLIDKLPFPMIGDAINDYLMSQERGFWTYTLPETVIALKQGFGRLNRTANDKGIVALYDGRLASSASYKNRIFNSFDFQVSATRDWNAVRDYIKNIEL